MRAEGTVERRAFTFKRCLGRGGFGEVYLATMTSSGGVTSDVAVKVLLQDLDVRSQAVQRLRDEGKLLGALNHPAILRVHDIVLLEQRVALVTEFVDGADLSQIFKTREELPTRALVEIVGRVADALHAAWTSPSPRGGELHLVHRDIKPQNIRLGKHGDVKLLDFGIARASNEEVKREAHTATNVVVGSFGYISPERMFSSGAIVPAGDIFALGCVLFQGLTREAFFHRIEEKRMYQLALDPGEYERFAAKRLEKAREKAKTHGELLGTLVGMLQFEPENRPTAHEVAIACEHLAEDMPGLALKRWCRERQWPEADLVPGALDGKMITEATLARTGGKDSVPLPPEPLPLPAKAPPTSGGSAAKTGLLVGGGVAMALSVVGAGAAVLLVAAILVYALSGTGAAPAPAVAPAAAVVVEPPVKEVKRPTVTVKPAEPVAPPAASVPAPKPTASAPAPKPPMPAVAKPVTVAPADPPPVVRRVGKVVVDGGVKMELWSANKTYPPGDVPAGHYDVRVDFGSGLLEPVSPIDVKAGATVSFKCSKLRQTCAVESR